MPISIRAGFANLGDRVRAAAFLVNDVLALVAFGIGQLVPMDHWATLYHFDARYQPTGMWLSELISIPVANCDLVCR